ncbi:MAG TPA: NADH-quinone oxidoreductase subunit N [Anaerolineales bacterium]|nr:NADH-quinone oxidoreductase subunit N [Anaerolineales bacterium]
MTISDFNAILPLLVLSGWACALLLVDLWIPKDRKAITAVLTICGLAVTTAVLTAVALAVEGEPIFAFGGMVTFDGFTVFLNGVVLLVGATAILLALNYLKQANIERGEFYSLLLFSIVGMMMMASASDLIVVFLALETLSIPLYVLSGFARPRLDSEESALKYFLLGAFSSGFLVYGIALTYGATMTTNLAQITAAVAANESLVKNPLLLAGMALILVGLGFKVAAVPFHMWTPDVYEGAPTVVTAFMSVGAKIGGFAALIRVFFTAFPSLAADWVPVVAVISALTMILGNVAAIAQSSIKRMLAYSSIAHAGYILMAAVAGGTGSLAGFSASAAMFYLLGYAIMNLGAWAVVIAVEKDGQAGKVDDFAGLGATRAGLALAMTLFMLSLTGLPPTVGFVGKFYVFNAAIQAGYLWLALVGVITSLISAFYYLRIVMAMWMKPGEGAATTPLALNWVVSLTAVATFILGIVPGPLMAAAERALLALFAKA